MRPDRLNGVRQALQSVADHHAHVIHAAVLDLGEDVHPVLGALAAVAGPQPEDVPPAFGGDRECDVDGPVRNRTITDFHVDCVDEDHRIDRVEGPVLPLGHAFQNLVGDRRDGLATHLSAIDLGQMGLDLARRQALRRERDDHLVHSRQALLPLRRAGRADALGTGRTGAAVGG